MKNYREKTCVLIPAKGESIGLKNKNIAMLNGDSLIGISTNQGYYFASEVWVSTESQEIWKHCMSLRDSGKNAPSIHDRGQHLSTSDASTYAVVIDALPDMIEANTKLEWIIVLQCTHPFRRVQKLISQLDEFFESGKECGFSGSPAFNHIYMTIGDKILPENRTWDKRPRRQEMVRRVQDDGSFFISRIDRLAAHGDLIWDEPFIFSGNYCGPDIHTQEDLDIARALWKKEFIDGVP